MQRSFCDYCTRTADDGPCDDCLALERAIIGDPPPEEQQLLKRAVASLGGCVACGDPATRSILHDGYCDAHYFVKASECNPSGRLRDPEFAKQYAARALGTPADHTSSLNAPSRPASRVDSHGEPLRRAFEPYLD